MTQPIEVRQLRKTFQTKRKAAGLGGSFRSLFKPEYAQVEAARGISFEMELVEVCYAQEVAKDFALPGAEVLKVGRYGVKLKFDAAKTHVGSVLAGDVAISDPPLEEVIAKMYQEANS